MANPLSHTIHYSSQGNFPIFFGVVDINIVGPFTEVPVDCQFVKPLLKYYSKWVAEIAFLLNITTATVITCFVHNLEQRR